jgi:cobalt-zinc-cadmium efflux system outer membrane protein
MVRRSTYLFLFALLSFLAPSLRAQDTLSLPALLLKARDNNPDILAARHGWKVTLDEVAPTRAWPDPTFTYIDEKFPSGVDGVDPMSMKHYRIEQTIPFPGKLTNDAKMKYHEALIAEAKYRAMTLEVFRDVQSRYYQLYLTDKLIDLAQDSVGVLKQTLGSAQARLAGGQSSTADVFMVQTELRRMENMLFEQKQQRTLIEIELNTLLGQPVKTSLGVPQAPDLKDIPVTIPELEKLSSINNPLYRAAMHEVNHSRAMKTHHALQFLPDFGFMYEKETADAGPAGRQIGVSVTFPLWLSRPWGLTQSANEHILEAESTSQAMKNEVQKMVNTEFTETNTYLTQANNYVAGILPEAQSALKITRHQYASGQIDFVRFLEAFRTWIQTNNEYQDNLYRYGEHWSELERWVGVPLDKAKEALDQEKVMPTEMNHEK